MKTKTWVRAAGAAAVVLAAAAMQAQQPAQIDDALLKKAARRRRLAHLRTGPVRDALQPAHRHQHRQRRADWAWPGPTTSAAGGGGQEATPLVWPTAPSTASPTGASSFAVDARTGKEKWRWDPRVNQAAGAARDLLRRRQSRPRDLPGHDLSRRSSTAGCRRSTPRPARWCGKRASRFRRTTTRITMAPRIAKGKVIIGVSGGDRPTRGFFDAYDAMTGRRAWRFYTVPGDPSKRVRERGDEEGGGDLGQGVVEERRRRRGVGRHGLRPRGRSSSTSAPATPSRGRSTCARRKDKDNLYACVDPRRGRRHRRAEVALPGRARRQLGLRQRAAPDPRRPADQRARRAR